MRGAIDEDFETTAQPEGAYGGRDYSPMPGLKGRQSLPNDMRRNPYMNGDFPAEAPAMGGAGNQLSGALKAVQEALSFGRQRYGLGQQTATAARMPMAPGTQSESGRRERPMPGPLQPTSNPFGKRAEAEEPDEAIDTDDEEMA